MLLVSTRLVITLFAWFPANEDEDKGLSCLQPQGTHISDDHSLGVPGPPHAHRRHHQPLGDHRREGNKENGQRARAPHISKGADHRLSKIQTLVHKTDISPRDRCIFHLITSLAGINRVEEVRELFGCFSLQTSLQGSKHSRTLHCWQNVIYIYLCVCEGWGAGGRALTFHQPHGASPAGQTSAARTHAHRGC